MDPLNLIKSLKAICAILFVLYAQTTNAQTTMWTGSSDDNWETSSNWSDNAVPDENIDVIVPSGCTFYPTVENVGESCKSLTIKDGGTLYMCVGGSLTVNGDLTVGEGISGNLDGYCGTLNITGNLILNSGSKLILTSCYIYPSSTSIHSNSSVVFVGSNYVLNNWDYGNLELKGTGKVDISGDFTSPTTCVNLLVDATGNYLNIPENKCLTVTGNVINNAGTSGIVCESSVTGDGSIILNTADIDATLKRYLTGNRWHYISSPINEVDFSMFDENYFIWWDASVEWEGLGDYAPWKSYSGSNLNNGQGYAYYYSETTLDYSGKINVGNYNVTLYKSDMGNAEYQGWNLIGNPFSSVLDWDALIADGSYPLGAENAIYFFDDDGTGSQNNYRYYVPSSGGTYGVGTEDANGYIPLGQAFFVKTNTDNVSLTMKSTYRTHAGQGFYKNNNENEIIRLTLFNNENSDQMIIRQVETSTFEFDSEFDARKLFSSDENIPQIYFLTGSGSQKLAISSVPGFEDYTVLKLGLKAPEGIYNIKTDELFVKNNPVFLYDRYLDMKVNLSIDSEYVFDHFGGESDDRFEIIFTKSLSTYVHENSGNLSVFPVPAKDKVFVSMKSNEKFNNLKLISLDGKILIDRQIFDDEISLDITSFNPGIYFLEVDFDNFSKEIRKIIIDR